MKKIISLLSLVVVFAGACTPFGPERFDPELELPDIDMTELPEAPPREIVNVTPSFVEVSSVLEDNTGIGFGYYQEMAFDKDFSTAWCSAESDNATMRIVFDSEVQFGKMGIVPGFARDEAIFAQNPRVKDLDVKIDGDHLGVLSFSFDDKYGMQFVDLSAHSGSEIELNVRGFYEGSKYDDVCIAEVDFWSDYVLEEDAGEALKYYEENKADGAVRPVDIVERVYVTDFVYALDYGAPESEYVPERCESSFYAPTESKLIDYYGDLSNGFHGSLGYNMHAFAKINQYGSEGDVLEAIWELNEVDYAIDEEFGGPDFENVLRNEWVRLDREKVLVEETCDGSLWAYSMLPKEEVRWRGMFGSLGYRVRFVHNGVTVGESAFNAGQ